MTETKQPLTRRNGPSAKEAKAVLILLHGRGGSADDIISLAPMLVTEDWAALAPQAPGHSWYPHSFLAERSENEPWLSSSLQSLKLLVDSTIAVRGGADGIFLAGFSQGACLASEFVGRNPAGYGGLISFTGGLIGPLGTPLQVDGKLFGMPALLSGGDRDPHVPWQRIEDTARLLRGAGANVIVERYAGKPHGISAPEIAAARRLLLGE